MSENEAQYDPRYLAGILFFNRGDFFEAHEVWEALWMDTTGGDKKYFQGLIQAAVALYHFCNGNLGGAIKLFKSSRDYMARYGTPHLGLDQEAFWQQMGLCFAEVLTTPPPVRADVPEALIPTIALDPPPASWPDPEAFLEPEHE